MHASARRPRISPALRSEVARAMRFDAIRYSSVWEDIGLLRRALRIAPDDDVLVVTSAGDNVLGLLLDAPRSVTAVDLNPCQSALLHLKLAALRALDHADFVALVGVRPHPDRWGLYRVCRPHLPLSARTFWDDQRAMIEAGIEGQGRLDRYIAGWRDAFLFPVLPPEEAAALFELDDLDAQAEAFQRLATPAFRAAFEWYFGEAMMARHGRDPAQFAHVEIDAGAHFFRRFRHAFTRLPLRGNFYLERFMTGAVADLERAHPYHRPANYARLQALADRVEVVTSELEVVACESSAGQFSKAALSDVFEYVSAPHAEALLQAFHRALRPVGRLAYWSLLVDRTRSPRLDGLYRSQPAEALWRADRAWFYRSFHIEDVLAA